MLLSFQDQATVLRKDIWNVPLSRIYILSTGYNFCAVLFFIIVDRMMRTQKLSRMGILKILIDSLRPIRSALIPNRKGLKENVTPITDIKQPKASLLSLFCRSSAL